MKKILNCLLISAVVIGFSSCEKFLDVNTNPNSATTATAALVLPQAIVGTASISNTFSQSYSYPAGMFANVAGVGGYGATLTYAYTTSSFTGLWTSTLDNATDYKYVIDQNGTDATLAYSTSIARIMKAFAFARMVDQYNDIPYSKALLGTAALTPTYDKAEDVYKDLVKETTEAIAAITAAQASAATQAIASTADPLFKGDMDKWKRFANTLRLRLLIKMAGVPALTAYATPLFATTASVGYLTDDALVNPGYLKEAGRMNPVYGSLAASATNVRSQTSATTTKWMLAFYNGVKFNDVARGSVIFRAFPNTPANQLGDESAGAVAPIATYTAWFTGADFNTTALGVAKGPTQGAVIMLKAESDFLQAEAQARGYITSGDAGLAAFENGIKASYNYLYKNASDVATKTAADATTFLNDYKANNATSWNVNYTLAPLGTDYNQSILGRKIEAIITQKYIALANIQNDEAFNEYRRTAWPRVVTNGANPPTDTFASKSSVATTPDKIITRILYPQEEYNLNPSNVPTNISLYTSKIFWDVN
ncbi:SusD/RagB family nutrient-binding outer membrane lipoprotein [Pedobacter frigiditerrae]|uniref:SusD/RagB family nutrient-binding outer membrane lipoprotein n=1 Tax=Pedobacter frigiditerrae TaxID=2530452 RepID=A0A4R0N2T6_9SPHI|nr:SusD/RagB family nutrient-binding outer membrane lipoprotein [Pedobacter frigiditerrae]TCC94025.1 SusD/RagB family nutrient-binding outer membrane lipoprotein [Pedobacter frigiditerrae]